MFCIKLAGIPIGIENRYSALQRICRDYITGEEPLFTVSASEQELLEEQAGRKEYSLAYCESLCVYRNLCQKLPHYGAFLLHSAVLAVDGAAYAFTAPSGTGKTTHLRLWQQLLGDKVRVVNGDKPIYRFIGDTLYACGTPWQGKEHLGCNMMQPLQAFCFLEQSPTNEIRRLSSEEVSNRIFHQILIPSDPSDFDRFWPLLERLVTTIDFYLLRCNMDLEAAQLSYETMRRKQEC